MAVVGVCVCARVYVTTICGSINATVGLIRISIMRGQHCRPDWTDIADMLRCAATAFNDVDN